METVRGRVVKIQGNQYRVQVGKTSYLCDLKGTLKRERLPYQTVVTIGDEVTLTLGLGGHGRIDEVQERRGLLAFPDSDHPRKEHLIAAHLSQVAIVSGMLPWEEAGRTIDRSLVLCEKYGLPTLICFNKIDVPALAPPREWVRHYEQYGYPVFLVSALTGEGVQSLEEALQAVEVTLFLGVTGSGKSSLVNALQDQRCMKVGTVRPKTGRGRHTTTWSEMVFLRPKGIEAHGNGPSASFPSFSYVVDTPGFEDFGYALSAREIVRGFRDLKELSKNCQFSDCIHRGEPQCYVKDHLDENPVLQSRYRHCQELLDQVLAKPKR